MATSLDSGVPADDHRAMVSPCLGYFKRNLHQDVLLGVLESVAPLVGWIPWWAIDHAVGFG